MLKTLDVNCVLKVWYDHDLVLLSYLKAHDCMAKWAKLQSRSSGLHLMCLFWDISSYFRIIMIILMIHMGNSCQQSVHDPSSCVCSLRSLSPKRIQIFTQSLSMWSLLQRLVTVVFSKFCESVANGDRLTVTHLCNRIHMNKDQVKNWLTFRIPYHFH